MQHYSGKYSQFLTILKTTFPCINIALKILKKYPTMAYEREDNNDGKTALHMLAQKAASITSSSWQRITANDTSLIKYFFSKPGPILTLWQLWAVADQIGFSFSLFIIIIIIFFLSLSSKNFAVCGLSFQTFGHYNIAPRITHIIFRPKVIWPTEEKLEPVLGFK